MHLNKSYKLYIFKKNLKEKGLYFTFKEKVIPCLLRPFLGIIKRNRFLIEVFYGVLPNLRKKIPIFRANSRMVKIPKSQLVEEVRKFWYSNTPGNFNLDGEMITRQDIFIYGGPNPFLSCPVCQKSEWLSRVRQKNLYLPHFCQDSKKCQILCSRQGNDLWTHFHQNFGFSIGCDQNLPAPKCLYISYDKSEDMLSPRSAYRDLVFRRQMAYVGQVDPVFEPVDINFQNYDFLYVFHSSSIRKFPRPNLPIILYGHDFWPLEDKSLQWGIDWLKPDILLTSYPGPWKEYFKIPKETKVVFSPLFESSFFARPNLEKKNLDLLVIGALSSSIYEGRRKLTKQISELKGSYKIEFSHLPGHWALSWQGETFYKNPEDGTIIRYLNKWSEYLGSAKYVAFGPMKWDVLVGKYAEVLGSGATPIFPEIPDLKLLGVKAFEHYIPLSEIEGNNERLAYFLDHYDNFRYIAENAVNWYKENSDRMLFNDFEDLIREITNYQYPKRLI